MPGSRYCFLHQSWGVPAILTLVAGALLRPPLQWIWEQCVPPKNAELVQENSKFLQEVITDKPSLDLFLNGIKISNRVIIPVPKSGELKFMVSNVGKGTAEQIMVDVFTPKPWTNVETHGQWHQQLPLVTEKEGKLEKNEDWLHWSFISDFAIPGGASGMAEIPPIHLGRQGPETFLHVRVDASAKHAKPQSNQVILRFE